MSYSLLFSAQREVTEKDEKGKKGPIFRSKKRVSPIRIGTVEMVEVYTVPQQENSFVGIFFCYMFKKEITNF